MDHRQRAKHSRASLPVGTLRVRRDSNGKKVRSIKVRNSGPFQSRWIDYARYLWEKDHGPVPPGKRVIHEDGDQLNDARENLALGDAADVVALWHLRNPELSRRNHEACRAATSAHNRLRAHLRRQVGFLRRWYAVDFARSVIVNRPCRKRHQVYGPGFGSGLNKGGDAAALGWPGRGFLEACILTVLAEGAGVGRADAIRETLALRQLYGWAPLHSSVGPVFSSAISKLKRAGLVRSSGAGTDRHYCLADGVRRGPASPFVPVHGTRLQEEGRFRLFAKVEPEPVTA